MPETQDPKTQDEETQEPEQTAPAPEPPAARPRRIRRALLRLLAVVVAVVAGVLVTVLTFDLGPSLRRRAETEGTKYMERPMHIGRLSAKLTPGVFVIEDLLIEGLSPRIGRSSRQRRSRSGFRGGRCSRASC